MVWQSVDVEFTLVSAVGRRPGKKTSSSSSSSVAAAAALGPPLFRLGEQAVVDEPLTFDDAEIVLGVGPVKEDEDENRQAGRIGTCGTLG